MAETQLEVIKKTFVSSKAIKTFEDALPNCTGEHAVAVAKRFAKMCCTAITNNPSLQGCSVSSLIRSASVSASLDLDIDVRGLAYLVPYKNNGVMEAQFQIGYLGLMELAYRSGKVTNISAHCIYESEKKQVTVTREDGRWSVVHPFSWDMPTGEIVAVYATAYIKDHGPVTSVLRAAEVEKLRKRSKAPNSPAWTNDKPAMYKKTVVRQLAKFLPKSITEDLSKGAAMDEIESFDNAQGNAQEHINQTMGSEIIDAEPIVDEATGELRSPDAVPDPNAVPSDEDWDKD